MNPYNNRHFSLDPGLTALALRAIQERDGHYPFMARFLAGGRARGRLGGRTAAGREAGRGPAPRYFAVVRRGEREICRRLEEQFQGEPDVQVIWDRRVMERRSVCRRVGFERRRGERRCTPPSVWENATFVLVPQVISAKP